MKTKNKMPVLFEELLACKKRRFPKPYQPLDAPTKQGVYAIYDEAGTALHVGKSSRGTKGLKQRLKNHVSGTSSFKDKYLKPNVIDLRESGRFQFVIVDDPYERAIFEAYAIGHLCPIHIGLNNKVSN